MALKQRKQRLEKISQLIKNEGGSMSFNKLKGKLAVDFGLTEDTVWDYLKTLKNAEVIDYKIEQHIIHWGQPSPDFTVHLLKTSEESESTGVGEAQYFVWLGVSSLSDEEYEEVTGYKIPENETETRDYLKDIANYHESSDLNPLMPFMHRTNSLEEACEVARNLWEFEKKLDSCPENPYQAGIHIYDTLGKKDIDFERKKYGGPYSDRLAKKGRDL